MSHLHSQASYRQKSTFQTKIRNALMSDQARPQNIVILTGAGISKESGLSTFRGSDGLYNSVSIEEVATPEAFARNPSKVHEFYNNRRTSLLSPSIVPNAAHIALSKLQQSASYNVTLVTQNVDDLHERGGSSNVIHMHGEILKARCLLCKSVFSWRNNIDINSVCPSCGCKGNIRVHVVWFGEVPFELERIDKELQNCDIFVAIGTSGTVYPAAGFVELAREAGAHTVELNLESSGNGTNLFHEGIYGPATQIVPLFVDRLV